jgi:hypothetical protein
MVGRSDVPLTILMHSWLLAVCFLLLFKELFRNHYFPLDRPLNRPAQPCHVVKSCVDGTVLFTLLYVCMQTYVRVDGRNHTCMDAHMHMQTHTHMHTHTHNVDTRTNVHN